MTDDELSEQLRPIIMKWRHKVGKLERDVCSGRISTRKYMWRWSSEADDEDEKINKALAAELLSLIRQREAALLERVDAEVIGEDESREDISQFGPPIRNAFRQFQRTALTAIKKEVGGNE